MGQALMNAIKYIIGSLNLIFVVFSILTIYYGAQTFTTPTELDHAVETPDKTAIFLMIIGSALFLISFLGCWGTFMDNHCVLTLYGIILTTILLFELIIGGIIIGFEDELDNAAKENLQKLFDNFEKDKTADNKKIIDGIQSSIRCCGGRGPEEYNPKDIPASCCPSSRLHPRNDKVENLLKMLVEEDKKSEPKSVDSSPSTKPLESKDEKKEKDESTTESHSKSTSSSPAPAVQDEQVCELRDAYTDGCVNKGVTTLKKAYNILGIVVLAFTPFMLLGILFAFYHSHVVRREYEVI